MGIIGKPKLPLGVVFFPLVTVFSHYTESHLCSYEVEEKQRQGFTMKFVDN